MSHYPHLAVIEARTPPTAAAIAAAWARIGAENTDIVDALNLPDMLADAERRETEAAHDHARIHSRARAISGTRAGA